MENISKILEAGNSKEKIRILEDLEDTTDPKIIEKIISKLDDDDIQVRGEAFSTLILNKNKISDFLIKNLNSANKNIRGFTSMVLANRNETSAIPEIIKLVRDESSMVRSCAIGSLGHLKAWQARDIFLESLLDSNLEVKKSALQAVIDLEIKIPKDIMNEIIKEKDSEIKKLLCKLKDDKPE